jgi:hypothetical protein
MRARLAALDATQLPAAALTQIERDVLTACQRAVLRAITGPRIGRAVAAALAAPAAKQGRKGAQAPLPSSATPVVAESVAGLTDDSKDIPAGNSVAGASTTPAKEAA